MTDVNHQLVESIDRMRKAVDQLRDELVRKDVFLEVQNNINTRFKSVEDDIRGVIDDRKADRRLLFAVIIGPFVMLLIGVYIAIQVGGPPA